MSGIEFFIVEIDRVTHLHTNLYRFPSAGYRQSVSFGSFFWGKNQRNYSPTKIYVATSVSHLEMQRGWPSLISKHKVAELDSDRVIYCKSLFDFYDKVGYNRKQRKWLNTHP
jgi:hypothetical protein